MRRLAVLLTILLASSCAGSVAHAEEITWVYNYNGLHCPGECVDDGQSFNGRECQPECGYELWTMNPDGSGAHIVRSSERGQIHDPAWSPDGRFIAYTKRVAVPGSFEEVTELRVVGTKDSADDRVVAGGQPGVRATPAWSPDSRTLVFQLRESQGGFPTGEADLWLVGADGSNLRRVTQGGLNESDPAFSPDGRRITFAGSEPGKFPTLFSIALDGADTRRLAVGDLSVGSGVQFSPDGRNMAFNASDGRLLVTPTGGGEIRRVASGRISFSRWSPRGDAFLFAGPAPGYVGPPTLDLWRVNLGPPESEPVRLTRFQGTPSYGGGHAWLGSPAPPLPTTELAAPAVTLAREVGSGDMYSKKLTFGPTTATPTSRLLAVNRSSELRFLAADRTGIRSLKVSVARRRAGATPSRSKAPVARFRPIGSSRAWRKLVRGWRPGVYELRFRTVDVRGQRSTGRRSLRVRVRGH